MLMLGQRIPLKFRAYYRAMQNVLNMSLARNQLDQFGTYWYLMHQSL